LQTVSKDSIKTFRPLGNPNLLIAVSFGLFIPPRLISTTEHTINLHPSLLPQYMGPAPIHHAIKNGDTHTGVSLQTISPVAFDGGIIFNQSDPIPIEPDEHFLSLWDRLAAIGAEMLLESVRSQSFRDPMPVATSRQPSLAPRLVNGINWEQFTSEEAVRFGRVINPCTGAITLDESKRVDIHVRELSLRQQNALKPPGTYFLARHGPTGLFKMVVVCKSHQCVWVENVKVSGKGWISGVDFVKSAPDRFWGGKFVPYRREFSDHSPEELGDY
jgi:methionyl-tRNA formyltransferase